MVTRQQRPVPGFWAAVAAAALAACGSLKLLEVPSLDAGALLGAAYAGGGSGAAGDGGAGNDGGLGIAGLCPVLLEARCGSLQRCGLLSDAGAATCRSTLAHTWCGPRTWPSHVAVGALRLDQVAALRCAGELAASACEGVLSPPAACAEFLVPAAGLGQPCFDGYLECAEGVCRGATCPKSCQAPGAAGAACALSAECQAGLICRLSPTAVGQCAAPGGPDAGCDPATPCAAPLACVQARCQGLPAPGQPCLLGQCGAGGTCAADAGICVARLDGGSPCTSPSACAAGLTCAEGACAPAVVGPGAPCALPQACQAPGEVCVGPAGRSRCQPPLDGGSCQRDEECLPALACQGPADGGQACGPRLPAGAACDTTRQCQLDAECLLGTCQPRPRPGEACGPAACLEGLCRGGLGADGGALCGDLLVARTPCTADAQCASGHCALGYCLTACTP